jgi:hypothetical protein
MGDDGIPLRVYGIARCERGISVRKHGIWKCADGLQKLDDELLEEDDEVRK